MAHCEGYAKVSRLMSRNHEFGIFRAFKALNFQNLLYFQAELTQLEQELKEIADADWTSYDPVRQYYIKHWQLLSESQDGGHDEQWQKIMQIRQVLKEYNDCLLQQGMLSSLQKPTKYELGFMRDWLVRKAEGDRPIISDDREAWSDATEHDLVRLDNRTSMDAITAWTSEKFLPTYHFLIGKHHKQAIDWDPSSGISLYKDTAVRNAAEVLATVVSCLFPILSIVSLYHVNSAAAQIGVIAAFTAFFSLCLAVMTSGRRIEIFAATSAYAAVLVVFISTNGSSSNRG